MQKYKFLEHISDLKFQAFGNTIEQAFENSALALVNAMCKEKINNKIKKTIKVKGKDKESLLYNFLEEFLYFLDTENFILGKILKMTIKHAKEYALEAEVSGDKAENYNFDLDVKAITYNQMFVKQQKGKFICQVVLDV